MNSAKFTFECSRNETIINFNLAENDKISFHKKEKSNLKKGDKICTIDSGNIKTAVVSPIYGRIDFIIDTKVVISECLHEMEFSGMCADCGVEIR